MSLSGVRDRARTSLCVPQPLCRPASQFRRQADKMDVGIREIRSDLVDIAFALANADKFDLGTVRL